MVESGVTSRSVILIKLGVRPAGHSGYPQSDVKLTMGNGKNVQLLQKSINLKLTDGGLVPGPSPGNEQVQIPFR